MNSKYQITTMCFGRKYLSVEKDWAKRIASKCPTSRISVLKIPKSFYDTHKEMMTYYAWWDPIRLQRNIHLLETDKLPVIHCDMDIIVERDLSPLVNLDYDLIFSLEHGGDIAFPPKCSGSLGFGICSGFYIMKLESLPFMKRVFELMRVRKYGSFSDQETIMNILFELGDEGRNVEKKSLTIEGQVFPNNWQITVFRKDGQNISPLRILVLDMDIIDRDPVSIKRQYANHINIDNVGGTPIFLRFFHEPMSSLPRTCRCGKMGDTTVCTHYPT